MELYYRRLKVGETVNEKKKSFQPMFFARLPTRTREHQPERIVHCGLHPRIHGVHRLYVDAPDKSSGKRRQKVHIEYDLVGYIPVDELRKAEQA